MRKSTKKNRAHQMMSPNYYEFSVFPSRKPPSNGLITTGIRYRRRSWAVTVVSLPAAAAASSGGKPSFRVSNILFSYCCSFFILVASGEKSFKYYQILQIYFFRFCYDFVGFPPAGCLLLNHYFLSIHDVEALAGVSDLTSLQVIDCAA